MKWALRFSLLVLAAGCSKNLSNGSLDAATRGGVLRLADAARIAEQLPYATISLTITPTAIEDEKGFLDISLGRDGRATCEGHLPGHIGYGQYRGTVHLLDFARICQVLDRFRFADLAGSYEGHWTHLRRYVLRAHDADGTTREVSDYGEAGPIELWAMRSAVEAVALRIEWQPTAG